VTIPDYVAIGVLIVALALLALPKLLAGTDQNRLIPPAIRIPNSHIPTVTAKPIPTVMRISICSLRGMAFSHELAGMIFEDKGCCHGAKPISDGLATLDFGQQFRQLGDVADDPSRFIFAK
jgi:hypothetical protein